MSALTVADIRWTLTPLKVEPTEDDPLVEVLFEAESYRCVMQEALHALSVVVREYDQLEKRYHRLLDERGSK